METKIKMMLHYSTSNTHLYKQSAFASKNISIGLVYVDKKLLPTPAPVEIEVVVNI